MHNLRSLILRLINADRPVHVSMNSFCMHRGHQVAAKPTATSTCGRPHLPLVSAGFALRLGSALDGATNPLLLIALHERSVLFLACNDACSEQFAAISAWLCKAPEFFRSIDSIEDKQATAAADKHVNRADRPMQNVTMCV